MIGVTPYAAVQAQAFHTPTYGEAGLVAGGFALTDNARDATDTRGELGARFDDVTMIKGMPLALRGKLAWRMTGSVTRAHRSLPGPARCELPRQWSDATKKLCACVHRR